jgi:hypothetical protein
MVHLTKFSVAEIKLDMNGFLDLIRLQTMTLEDDKGLYHIEYRLAPEVKI